MRKYTCVFLIVLGFFSIISHAKLEYVTPNQVKQKLELKQKQKELKEQIEKEQSTQNTLVLPNGKSINLNEWNLVVFIQSTCVYCHEFDPKIKAVAEELNIKPFVFSFDGIGDSTFREVFPVNDKIVAAFFRDLPVATPTTFIVNVNDLTTAPISQGSMTKEAFKTQIINTFVKLDNAQ